MSRYWHFTAVRTTYGALAVPLIAAMMATATDDYLSYTIKRGDTLSAIARTHGVRAAEIITLNALPGRGDLIYAGATLKIPTTAPAPPKTVAAPASTLTTHTVARGETLSALASRYGTTVPAILAVNDIPNKHLIKIGQKLKVPATKGVTTVKPAYPPEITAAANRNRTLLAERDLPSKGAIKTMIVDTAAKQQVDPSLALAIAWMESGWKQHAVSPGNAIGVMQVIPSTGRWLATKIGRDLDLLDTGDNITAGVYYLRLLSSGRALEEVIASYYQGPGSVSRNGMTESTKRYVTTVLALKKRYAGEVS